MIENTTRDFNEKFNIASFRNDRKVTKAFAIILSAFVCLYRKMRKRENDKLKRKICMQICIFFL